MLIVIQKQFRFTFADPIYNLTVDNSSWKSVSFDRFVISFATDPSSLTCWPPLSAVGNFSVYTSEGWQFHYSYCVTDLLHFVTLAYLVSLNSHISY